MSDAKRAELLIVGAGPVGLYAAYYAGFRGLDTVVVDALPRVGGQIAAFYPDAAIYDVPGFAAIAGADLVERLAAQARAFPIPIHLGEEIVALDDAPEGIAASARRRAAPDGALARYDVRAVLLATGIGKLSPQRRKEDALARWEGRGLDYHGDDLAALAGRRALVVGGTGRAVELALALADVAAEVTLAHRSDRLAVDDATRDRLARSRARFLPFQELTALDGEARIERAALEDRRDGSRLEIALDAVLPCYGFAADPAPVRSFGLTLDGDLVSVDTHMASSRPGIWAVGDGATYPGKVRVLAADFGEACTAVNNIAAAVIPGAKVFPGYSSHVKGAARRPRKPT